MISQALLIYTRVRCQPRLVLTPFRLNFRSKALQKELENLRYSSASHNTEKAALVMGACLYCGHVRCLFVFRLEPEMTCLVFYASNPRFKCS